MRRRSFVQSLGAAALAAGSTKAAADSRPGSMTLALCGDCLPARRLSVLRDRDFTELVDLLRRADCTWANGETLFLDTRLHKPGHKGIDPHASCPTWGADELAWMGIDFVGLANNHIMDFGESGMASTLEHLNRVGITFAGAGGDLDQAAQPGYADSAAGRVGQVSFCSTHPDWFAASHATPFVNGRAGLNPLNVDYSVSLPEEVFRGMWDANRQVIDMMGVGYFLELFGGLPKDRLRIRDLAMVPGDEVMLHEKARENDLKRITEAIAVARGSASVVLATIHSHESRNSQKEPANFMQPTAHACIDAGADAYIGTGPHLLRGIEIYKGKPIFYSLGNFIFQYESIKAIPAEAWVGMGFERNHKDTNAFYDKIPYYKTQHYWESVVPLMTCRGGAVERIELYPIVMGFGLPRHERGTPRLARGEDAKRIIESLAELSKPFGTEIRLEDERGVISSL